MNESIVLVLWQPVQQFPSASIHHTAVCCDCSGQNFTQTDKRTDRQRSR